MDCDSGKDSFLQYALGTLEGSERETIRAHLGEGCPKCLGRLAEAEAILSLLPLSLPQTSAPASARAQVLKIAQGSHRSQPGNTTNSAQTGPSERRAKGNRARLWIGPALWGAGVAACIGGLIAINGIMYYKKSIDKLNDKLVRTDVEMRQLQGTIKEAGKEAGQVNRLVGSPSVQVVTLKGTQPQPLAGGRLLWDGATKSVRFYGVNLKNLSAAQTYELWLINDQQRKIPVGTFVVDAGGQGSFSGQISVNPGVIVATAVTDEPVGGVPQPTGTIQLVGKVN